MVAPTLDQELSNFILTMREQGILDHHFENVKSLQNDENPRFVLDIINTFSHDADHCTAEISHFLNAETVNFQKIVDSVHKLKGACSSVGGQRMALACRELRTAAENKEKERCIEMFETVKEEYSTLRNCMNEVARMERTVAAIRRQA